MFFMKKRKEDEVFLMRKELMAHFYDAFARSSNKINSEFLETLLKDSKNDEGDADSEALLERTERRSRQMLDISLDKYDELLSMNDESVRQLYYHTFGRKSPL